MSVEGEIKGRLLLDSDQFRADVLAAREKLAELTATKTDVKVTADTAKAQAALAAVEAAQRKLTLTTQAGIVARARLTDLETKGKATATQLAAAKLTVARAEDAESVAVRKVTDARAILTAAQRAGAAAASEETVANDALGKSIDRVSRRADSGAGRIALMTSAIVAAVPALLPVAGVATAGAGALAGLGAAGILAGTGVARGLKEGSAAAEPWRPLVNGVIDDIHKLQDTAAAGVLPGAEATFARLQVALPVVDRGIAEMARDLGGMAPTGLDAVVTLAERGAPLWRMGADELQRMVSAIDDFAHSDAYKGFIDYTVRNGPSVERFLTHTIELVGDIVTAWAPYGEAVLPVLDDTVVTVDHLVRALGPLPPMIAAGYVAFRGYTGVRTILDGITTGLDLMGVRAIANAEKVAAAERIASSGGAGGVGRLGRAVGAAGTAIGVGYAGYQVGAAAGEALGGTTNGSGAVKRGSVADVSSRALGNPTTAAAKDAVNRANSLAGGYIGGGAGYTIGSGAQTGAQYAQQVIASQKHLGAATTDTSIAQAKMARVSADVTSKLQAQGVADERLSARLSVTVAALDQMYAAQQNAAGGALDHELAVDGLKDAIAAAGAAVKQNGTSLDQNTAKGRANREQIAQAVQTINDYAMSQSNGGKEIQKYTQVQYTQAAALEKTMIQAGYTKKAAAEYIGTLLHLPAKKATVLQLEKAAAQAKLDAFKAKWDAMQSKSITLFARTQSVNDSGLSGTVAARRALGGTVGEAAGVTRAAMGMTVRGPGNAASDQAGRYDLANGEEITSNLRGQADRFRTVLKAINSGAVRSPAELGSALGGSAAPQVVRMHFTDDGSILAQAMRRGAEQAIAAHEARAERTLRMGVMDKGLLAAPRAI